MSLGALPVLAPRSIKLAPKEKKLEILNELDKRLGKEKESYIKLAYEW